MRLTPFGVSVESLPPRQEARPTQPQPKPQAAQATPGAGSPFDISAGPPIWKGLQLPPEPLTALRFNTDYVMARVGEAMRQYRQHQADVNEYHYRVAYNNWWVNEQHRLNRGLPPSAPPVRPEPAVEEGIVT